MRQHLATFFHSSNLPRLAASLLCVGLLTSCGSEQTNNSPKLLNQQNSFVGATSLTNYTDWPFISSSIGKDPVIEARISQILAGMSLAEKVGQMTQPEIKSITPAEVTQFNIGSVLNGGGSWPNNNKFATANDWVVLADQYYNASLASSSKIPLVWGTDAVHGHNNVFGATIFPHNIGLGAAHDKALIQRIGTGVGVAVRATGINWVFAPTLAVVRDDRWGRAYEGFSEEPSLVKDYATAYVTGLQGTFSNDGNVIGTAKHFIGDGGTYLGTDQGENQSSQHEMINIHGQGYYTALAAGVQTVMVSFNSWKNSSQDFGKMHGSKTMLTDVLKTKMGFDGLIVSDWNGIAQVPGCSNASCPQAINAGIDIIMVPDDWKAFISNTIAQVQSGQIPMARIDDAVTRILRVKLRAGLFNGKRPSQGIYAGKQEALQARALAREAVQKSLVLLKNNGAVLPLARNKRILVVGKSADSMQNQTGGWSLSWQGTGNSNSDFPNGDTILAGLREVSSNITFSADASGVNISPANFDAVIAVFGETPYAEGVGDINAAGTLLHSSRHPEDLALLQAVSGKGVPVVSVFVTGRPLYVNNLLNLSDAFVAAWLPGTEGKGVADVLMRSSTGAIHRDFTGTLSFSWPKSACQTSNNVGDTDYSPLFALGYGLRYTTLSTVPQLDTSVPATGCGMGSTPSTPLSIFNQVDKAPYTMYLASATNNWQSVAVGADLNATINVPASNPALVLNTVQINLQQDAKQVRWQGNGQIFAQSPTKQNLSSYLSANSALQFDMVVSQLPQGPVTLAMDCGYPCRGALDATNVFERMATGKKQTVKVPLACFAAKGTDFAQLDTPFLVQTAGSMTAAFTNIQIVPGAANDVDALKCEQLNSNAAKLLPTYTVYDGKQFAQGLSAGTWATSAGFVSYFQDNTQNNLALRFADIAGVNGLFYAITASPATVNLSAFANANVKFDVLVESYGRNTSGLVMKMESAGNHCITHDFSLGRPVAGSWHSFSIPLSQVMASREACFSLANVNAAFDILPAWGDQRGVQLRIKNVRFE